VAVSVPVEVGLSVAVKDPVAVNVPIAVNVPVAVTGSPGVATLMMGCVGNVGTLRVAGAIGGVVGAAAGGAAVVDDGAGWLLFASEQANIEIAKNNRPMNSRQRMKLISFDDSAERQGALYDFTPNLTMTRVGTLRGCGTARWQFVRQPR
jgi:hypothetical protein